MIDDLKIKQILTTLEEVSNNAYVPYSHFPVASAIVFEDSIVYGVNVENASYGLTICAERTCLASAIAQNKNPKEALAFIVYHKEHIVSSCGACRQVMSELLKQETTVILASQDGYEITNVTKLLPQQFSQEDLR